MNFRLLYSLIILSMIAMPSWATEYMYRDLKANTLPSAVCLTRQQAEPEATKPITLDRYGKRFCQSQGYGWHLEEIKNNGNTVCTDCAGQSDKQKCHVEDVVVTCKRIKPGSVGMLPGKG